MMQLWKRNSNGTNERYKAGLVIRDFNQTHGIDFVIMVLIMRITLALAAYWEWKYQQFDVKTAFLQTTM